jgi:hypothetical protein
MLLPLLNLLGGLNCEAEVLFEALWFPIAILVRTRVL